ncbi:MAG: PAS domain-containing sensor histidine kinase, partial [Anaerolineae bacterium]|nr:PAS domain-containing sensor histidine kinase [Anaerolineae bacterium]
FQPENRVLAADELQRIGFGSGLLLPVSDESGILGVLVLLKREADSLTLDHVAGLDTLCELAQLVLENTHLKANIATSRTIQDMARTMVRHPSSQDLLNILQQQLFSPQVTMAALLIYGPMSDVHPDGPFDYVQLQGTWSRRLGSGVARGIKIYLHTYQPLLTALDVDGVATLNGVRALREGLDPFVREIVRTEGAHSITLVELRTGGRKFGVLALGSRSYTGFTEAELDLYRTLSEFLALSTMTSVLQQENDLDTHARTALLDAVADGVLMVIPSGHNNTHVLTVNQAFSALFSLSPEMAVGRPLGVLLDKMRLPGLVREKLRDEWVAIPPTNISPFSGEFELPHPEGFPATIQWYSAPLYHDQQVFGRLFAFHDVSPERAASRLRANFISRVSHELRTPLTSIQGFADFILQSSGDKLPDLAREYTEIILTSAKHLNAMFSEIIDLARADVGEMKLNRVETHLPDLIIETVAMLEMHYKPRRQQVIMELDDDAPPVLVDMNRVRQVLNNLLTNAIKYSPPETTIRVKLQVVESAEHLLEDVPAGIVTPALLVTVADQGPGLATDETDKVFTPFYRTAAARASRTEGTGLGLAVARSIIELHQGKIWAEPKKRGRSVSRFHFTLPTIE